MLLGAVVEALAARLLLALGEAVGPRRRRRRKLLLALWPAVTAEEVRPVVRALLLHEVGLPDSARQAVGLAT